MNLNTPFANYVKSLSAFQGDEFLMEFTKLFANTIHADFSVVSRVNTEFTHAETIACYTKGRHEVNVSYEIIDTPCEQVCKHGFVSISKGIQEAYPKDVYLAENNIQAYFGFALKDKQGHVLGTMHCMFQRPVTEPESVLELYHFFSNWISSEIERSDDARKKIIADRDLKRISQRMSIATRSAGIGIWDLDLINDELIWDESMFQLYGLEPQNFGAAYDAWEKGVHPDDIEVAAEQVQLAINGEKEFDTEFRIVTPCGEIRHLKAYADVINDNQGNAIRMIGVNFDISESKRTDKKIVSLNRELENKVKKRTEELEAALAEAERANNAKTEFLSLMSHELRTPLNAIIGFSQLLQLDSSLPLEHSSSANEILGAGKHLLKLIDEVLDLAKIESGIIDLSIEAVEVLPVLHECLNLMKAQADTNHVSLNHSVFQDLSVKADRTRFKQALLNVLSNAIKYNKKGGSVTISAAPMDEDTAFIRIEDTGKGISANRLASLYTPFDRLGAENSDIEGTGIGLSITKSVLEKMSGNIRIESKVDKGSVFTIELPVQKASNNDSQDNIVRNLSENFDTRISQIGKKLVLYIEDNPANLRLVRSIFQTQSNIELIDANTPGLGIELALSYAPDLILLDINLPVMSGYQVLKLLRDEPKLEKTPVVAVSANAMETDVAKAISQGFDDYITKPFDINKFLDTTIHHLFPNQRA